MKKFKIGDKVKLTKKRLSNMGGLIHNIDYTESFIVVENDGQFVCVKFPNNKIGHFLEVNLEFPNKPNCKHINYKFLRDK